MPALCHRVKPYRADVGLVGLVGLVGQVRAADATATSVAPSAAPGWWLAAIPIFVPAVLAVVKVFVPRMPKVWLPIIAPVLGALIDLLMAGTWGTGTIMGAVAGSAGVGLREISDQVSKARAASVAGGYDADVAAERGSGGEAAWADRLLEPQILSTSYLSAFLTNCPRSGSQ